MLEPLRVAVIGCTEPAAHAHARGYLGTGECELVAVADARRECAVRFAAEYDDPVHVYDDYQELLDDERPDIVSVCLGPRFLPSAVLDAASADVRAIHGELPLAPTWGEAKALRKAVAQKGIQLTFNLAHRFLPSARAAHALVASGRLGAVQRLEGNCADLLERGTHFFDLFHFFHPVTSATSVLGQVASHTDRQVAGLPSEDEGLAEVLFRNGTHGLLRTGSNCLSEGARLQVVGTHGILEWGNGEVGWRYHEFEHAGWRVLPELEPDNWSAATALGIADLVQCLDTDDEPALRGELALRATELVFATYESSRSRGRVTLPLSTEDSAFLALLAAQEIGPQARASRPSHPR